MAMGDKSLDAGDGQVKRRQVRIRVGMGIGGFMPRQRSRFSPKGDDIAGACIYFRYVFITLLGWFKSCSPM